MTKVRAGSSEVRATATDELRRLLDERGVEYRVSATGYSIDIGPKMTAYANRTDTTLDVSLRGFTPEQAVEATLGPLTERVVKDSEKDSDGRGECQRVLYKLTGVLVCSECGAGIPKQLDKYCYLHFCPNCGRKVVDR